MLSFRITFITYEAAEEEEHQEDEKSEHSTVLCAFIREKGVKKIIELWKSNKIKRITGNTSTSRQYLYLYTRL